jgi:hypothetical protein
LPIRQIGDGFEDLRQESRAKRDRQLKAARRDATRINGVRRMDFSLVKDEAAAAQRRIFRSFFYLFLL